MKKEIKRFYHNLQDMVKIKTEKAKERLANLLRRWAYRLSPEKPKDILILPSLADRTFTRYEIERIGCRCAYTELDCLHFQKTSFFSDWRERLNRESKEQIIKNLMKSIVESGAIEFVEWFDHSRNELVFEGCLYIGLPERKY